MSIYVNDSALDTVGPDTQAVLEAAYRARTRPECRCSTQAQPMYIAKIGATYFVKRMPGTGAQHAPDCASFEAPEHLSGLSELNGTAIVESADDGTTVLKLDFALSKRGKQAPPPPASGDMATEAISNPKKLGLSALLQYLWHEADLVKWVPAMENQRWWGVVRGALRRGMASKNTKGLHLSDVVYIPEPFKLERAEALAAQRVHKFAQIAQRSEKGASLGILIAEYKSHSPSAFGAKFTFKHIPDCYFFADADLTKRFERVFEEQLILADLVDGTQVISIATFSMTNAGYPLLETIGLMLVTREFLPFEHLKEAQLLARLLKEKRSFIKQQRFNLSRTATVACALLSDTEDPVALFASPPTATADQLAEIEAILLEDTYPHWLWASEPMMPPLPAAKLKRRVSYE